jgi:hypothetical protein
MSIAHDSKKRDWRRHLRGWQAGALVLWLGAIGVALALPRPTAPIVLPVPAVDQEQSQAADRAERERAARARAKSLSHSTRLVGESVRRIGAASVRDPAQSQRLQRELARIVRRETEAGHTEELLELRALQAELFLEAVRAWERGEDVGDELTELGGDFAATVSRWTRTAEATRSAGGSEEHGTVAHGTPADRPEGDAAALVASPAGPRTPLVLRDADLRLLFRVRWGILTGTHRVHPFGPSLNEFRHYYATLLAHPAGTAPPDRHQSQLAVVGALSRIDSSYPAGFARGVLFSHLGDFAAAAQEFEQFARSQGDGPWLLLARNHWLYAKSHLN